MSRPARQIEAGSPAADALAAGAAAQAERTERKTRKRIAQRARVLQAQGMAPDQIATELGTDPANVRRALERSSRMLRRDHEVPPSAVKMLTFGAIRRLFEPELDPLTVRRMIRRSGLPVFRPSPRLSVVPAPMFFNWLAAQRECLAEQVLSHRERLKQRGAAAAKNDQRGMPLPGPLAESARQRIAALARELEPEAADAPRTRRKRAGYIPVSNTGRGIRGL